MSLVSVWLLVVGVFLSAYADRVPLLTEKPAFAGRDVVAYQQNIPMGSHGVRGLKEFSYNFAGFQFWFRNIENKNIFIDDPWRFIPQYGGFAAFGVCCEAAWDVAHLGPPGGVDVAWTFVDGKLYTNQWESLTAAFLKDDAGKNNIYYADQKWIEWFGNLRRGPFNTKCFAGHDDVEDVVEDMCYSFHNTSLDYSQYLANLDPSLLDPNYYKEPGYDCYYRPQPRAGDEIQTWVSKPNPCPKGPTSAPSTSLIPGEHSPLFYYGAIGVIVFAVCAGITFGLTCFLIRRKQSQIQAKHSVIVNLSDHSGSDYDLDNLSGVGEQLSTSDDDLHQQL